MQSFMLKIRKSFIRWMHDGPDGQDLLAQRGHLAVRRSRGCRCGICSE